MRLCDPFADAILENFCEIPDDIGGADATELPVLYTTATMTIMYVLRMRKGGSILIPAESTAAGQACIYTRAASRARVFTAAGSLTKRKFLHQNIEDAFFEMHLH